MAVKKFRVLEILLRLRYKVYEDYLCHLKTSYSELLQKHCRIVKERPIDFLKNMVEKGIPIETTAKYKDYEDTIVLTNPRPCACGNKNLSVVLKTNEMDRECLRFNGSYWVEEMPSPLAVSCSRCSQTGPIGYSYEEAVAKWNE